MGKISSFIRSLGKKRFNSAIILAAGSGTRFSGERKKKSERGFIVVDSNEGGKIRIAVEQIQVFIPGF